MSRMTEKNSASDHNFQVKFQIYAIIYHVQKNVLSQRLEITWYNCVEKLLRGTEF